MLWFPIHTATAGSQDLDKDAKEQLDHLEATRFRYRQEAADCPKSNMTPCMSLYWSNLMKARFFRLHRGYTLPSKHNKKLSNQRTGPFLIK